MFIQQKSIFSGFTYEIFDSFNNCFGEINWPDFALAKNSRLKSLENIFKKNQLTFFIQKENYTISFEYINRQWFNDIEFTLIEQRTNKILSVSKIISVNGQRRKLIQIEKPFSGEFLNKSSLFKIKYQILNKTTQEIIYTIEEPSGIQIKRKIELKKNSTSLEIIEAPIQVFLLFLALNSYVR